MRAALLRLWMLPWPRSVRRMIEPLTTARLVQRVLVPHFKVGVVAIIRDAEGRVLLFRHTYRTDYPWGLPSGFMERGEQPADALRREIGEEAGLTVRLVGIWRAYADTDRDLLNLVYLGSESTGRFAASPEISEARFYRMGDLPPLIADQRRLLESLAEEEG